MNKADEHPHSPNHGSNRGTGIIIAAVVILTLIAVWLVPGDAPEHADIPLPSAKPAPAADDAALQPAAAPMPSAGDDTTTTDNPAADISATDTGVAEKPAVPQVPEGQEAREFIAMAGQNGAPADILFDKAEDLSQSGKPADAYLLYFQAAREGHAGASIALAKQADPAFFSPENGMLDKPNITQARKWYLAAINAGDTSAAELLENLHLHVQSRAAAGDPEASRLLLQWK